MQSLSVSTCSCALRQPALTNALAHAQNLMVEAAAAGDFEEWSITDRGMMLDIGFSKLAQKAGRALCFLPCASALMQQQKTPNNATCAVMRKHEPAVRNYHAAALVARR